MSRYWRGRCNSPSVWTTKFLRGRLRTKMSKTPDWYSGLLQSAPIRVRIEGQN